MDALGQALQLLSTDVSRLDGVARSLILSAKAGAGSVDVVNETVTAFTEPFKRLKGQADRAAKLGHEVSERGAGAEPYKSGEVTASYTTLVAATDALTTLTTWAEAAAGFYATLHDDLTALGRWSTSTATTARTKVAAASVLSSRPEAAEIIEATQEIDRWLEGVGGDVEIHSDTWGDRQERWPDSSEVVPPHLVVHAHIIQELTKTLFSVLAARRACEDVVAAHRP